MPGNEMPPSPPDQCVLSPYESYNLDDMTDFVFHAVFSIVIPGFYDADPVPQAPWAFRDWACKLLADDELPIATILLGLSYFENRVHALGYQLDIDNLDLAEADYPTICLLTTALKLAEKALDDPIWLHTTRRWANRSGVPVEDLNGLEKEWLEDMDHRLFRDFNSPSHGYHAWVRKWAAYQAALDLDQEDEMAYQAALDM